MNNNNIINTINLWIYHLLTSNSIPNELISPSFYIEDGMNLSSYWEYEKDIFNNYSEIFDLNTNFKIKILHIETISEEVSTVYYYLLNHLDKIVFKNNISIDSSYKITSNNYLFQLVPKFIIKDNQIAGIGIAIKSSLELYKIISHEFELENLHLGSNYLDDNFYSAQFEISKNDNIQNTVQEFDIYYKENSKIKKEKRTVYFDFYDSKLFPVKINDINIEVVNELYPVHVVTYSKKEENNYSYPRNLSLPINNIEKIIVTDSLDNDWHIQL